MKGVLKNHAREEPKPFEQVPCDFVNAGLIPFCACSPGLDI